MSNQLGPENRISFFTEQSRLRRKTWHISAINLLALLILGLPLGIVVAPFFYLLVLGIVKFIGFFVLLPPALLASLKILFEIVPLTFQSVRSPGGISILPVWLVFNASAFYLLPGIISISLVWLGIRSLFMKAGTGGTVLYLGTREPSHGDLEEKQLVNIVEEVSLSAGIIPPRVLLLDSEIPNAAIVGSSKDDAVIVVTRGFLSELNREQTQAGIAHLIASAANGDLKIAISIMCLFQVFGFLSAFSDAFLGLSRSARKDFFNTLRWIRAGGKDPRTADAVAAMLTRSLDDVRKDDLTKMMDDAEGGEKLRGLGLWMRRIPPLRVLMIPSLIGYGVSLLVRMEIVVSRTFLIGPLSMLIWRTRRYLADAMAVQLTRNPEGLAETLEVLSEKGSVIPGGQWTSYLFIVGTEAARYRIYREIEAEAHEGKNDAVAAGLRRSKSGTATTYRQRKRIISKLARLEQGTLPEELGGILSSHPPLTKRLNRLRLMGAKGKYVQPKKLIGRPKELLLLILLSPLLILAFLFFLGALTLIYAVAGASTILLAGAVLAIAGYLFL
jgi:Zn-dependent protease with chaperone function